MFSKQMMEKAILGLLVAAFILVGFVFLRANANDSQPADNPPAGSISTADYNILPKGIPRVYGAELGVSYDDVSVSDQQRADAAISKLGKLDTGITLSGKALERYISIASNISCEYCCGADSIIFQNGQAACSCAHSYAMRGVAKYLISKHGSEFTDSEILEEMAKWKTLFFPAQMSEKAEVLRSEGIDANYINLASNKYRSMGG